MTDETAVPDPATADDGEPDAAELPSASGSRDAGSSTRDAARDDALGSSADGGQVLDGSARSDGGDATSPIKDAAVVDAKVDAATAPVDAGPPPLVCAGSTSACDGQCVNLSNDGSNCGSCNHPCGASQTCTNSQCVTPPQPTQVPAGCTARTYQNRTYAFCTQNRSWDDARSSCLGSKMDLVIVGDAGENDFVKANGDSWIGENDLSKEGQYVAVVPGNAGNNTGAPITFTNWRSGEPSNTQRCGGIDIFVGCLGKQTDEDCLMVYADGTWNDDLCTRSKGYVCEVY